MIYSTPNIRLRLLCLVVYVAISTLLLISPIYTFEQLLQNVHAPVMLWLLWRWRKVIWISDSGFVTVIVFLIFHAIGARWIYSFVPYNEWFGFNIDQTFCFERNMYDRFVHAIYGVLLFFPIKDLLHRRYQLKIGMAALMSLNIILSSSVFYELFEWFLAVTLSPEQAEAYNGQQGDMWDAQKDMALAGLGGLISYTIFGFSRLVAK